MLGSNVVVRASAVVVLLVVAAYLFAIMKCECGPLPIDEALALVLPWEAFRYFILIPFAMMAVEALLVGWHNSSLAAILRWTPSIRGDAFYLALRILFVPLTTAGLYLHLGEFARLHSLQLGVIENPVVQFAVVFVVNDFASYWVHRLMHASTALWEAHKVHHSATDLNLMMGFRFHPLESTVLAIVPATTFVLLGATLEPFAAFAFVPMLLGQVQHARVNWTFGLFGKVLVSPVFHRFHHSQHGEDFDHNFGARLVLWDQLFGTYSTRVIGPDDIGVDDNTYVGRPLLAEFFRPYFHFVVIVAARLHEGVGLAGASAPLEAVRQNADPR
jgi:sterol desaturase/sphingolipid hydroxylase (fatty acid hydroxylase superfamily)